MGFAYVKYGNEISNGNFKRMWMKFFAKADIKPLEGFEERGYEVTLPYGKKEKDIAMTEEINKKVFSLLEKMGVDIVAAEDYVRIPSNFEKSEGRYINAAFGEEILKEAVQKGGVNIADAEIVVKDGGDDESIVLMAALSSVEARISINTDRKGSIEPFLEQIYNDTGLCMGCFADENGKIMRQADVVISCVRGDDRNKCYKKGCVFTGIFTESTVFKKLAEKRSDMKFYGCPVFEKNGMHIKSSIAEAALRDWCGGKNRSFEGDEIREYAAINGIKYAGLYFAKPFTNEPSNN